jgi:hypothetical protein
MRNAFEEFIMGLVKLDDFMPGTEACNDQIDEEYLQGLILKYNLCRNEANEKAFLRLLNEMAGTQELEISDALLCYIESHLADLGSNGKDYLERAINIGIVIGRRMCK